MLHCWLYIAQTNKILQVCCNNTAYQIITHINIVEINNHISTDILKKNCFSYPDAAAVLKLAALISSSTAEVERSFFIMNLVSTFLQMRLLSKNQQLLHVYLQFFQNSNFIRLERHPIMVVAGRRSQNILQKNYTWSLKLV